MRKYFNRIIIINILVFFLQVSEGNSFIKKWISMTMYPHPYTVCSFSPTLKLPDLKIKYVGYNQYDLIISQYTTPKLIFSYKKGGLYLLIDNKLIKCKSFGRNINIKFYNIPGIKFIINYKSKYARSEYKFIIEYNYKNEVYIYYFVYDKEKNALHLQEIEIFHEDLYPYF